MTMHINAGTRGGGTGYECKRCPATATVNSPPYPGIGAGLEERDPPEAILELPPEVIYRPGEGGPKIIINEFPPKHRQGPMIYTAYLARGYSNYAELN